MPAQPALAKVNLFLHVLGRRKDGYHDLHSLVVFAEDVTDHITLTPSSTGPTMTLSGPFASKLSLGPENLVHTALASLCASLEILPHFSVVLKKNIPIGAGLGGGSADAAATIRAVLETQKKTLSKKELDALLLSLGSDVPVCFSERAHVIEGRGEKLHPFPFGFKIPAVLVHTGAPLSTGNAYQALRHFSPAAGLPSAFSCLDDLIECLTHKTRNDFWDGARHALPLLQEVYDALTHTPGARLVRLTGSGSCIFSLYGDIQEARAAAAALSEAYPSWWTRATFLR